MTEMQTVLRRGAAAALLSMLAACGGGGDGGPTPPPVTDPPPATQVPGETDHPSGLYWSWTTVRVPMTNPDGFTYWYNVFKYDYAKFFDNGLVYVGPPTPDYDSVQCSAPSQDAAGGDLCVRYGVSNGQITIGTDDPAALTKTAEGWTIGDKAYKPIALLHDARLDGSYSSYSCYLALCSHANFVFRPDGSFTASRFNSYANTIGDLFTGGGGGSDQVGTYRIEGHAITLEVQGAPGGRVFFFLDGDSLQIADDWYMKD